LLCRLATYSIIIPAFNEQELLPGTLSAVRIAMQGVDAPGEIIVADNNSTDKTAEIARTFGARIVFVPENQISLARNSGARIAWGRYLVFVDADTFISAELLSIALENLSTDICCGGGSRIVFEDEGAGFGNRSARFWKRFITRCGLAPGCFLYCRKDSFDSLGGFSEKMYAAEDLAFSFRLKRWGIKHDMAFEMIQDSPPITSSRKMKWFSPLRISAYMVLYLIFPFALRFRALCSLWYARPQPRRL